MANHPARVESPAVADTVRALRAVIPELRPAGRIGTIRNDGSRHTAGLAIDIMLDSRNAYEKGIADEIIAALIELHPRIRWHDILYTDWKDGRPFHFHIPGSADYAGIRFAKNRVSDPTLGHEHENHIHVDWVDFSLRIEGDSLFVYDWPRDARSTGFADDLGNRLALASRR